MRLMCSLFMVFFVAHWRGHHGGGGRAWCSGLNQVGWKAQG